MLSFHLSNWPEIHIKFLCPAVIVSPATIATSLSMQVKVQVIHWTTWDSDTGNTEHIQTHL